VSDPAFTLAAYWVATKSEVGKTASEINYLKDQLLASHSGVDKHRFGEVAESLKRSASKVGMSSSGPGNKTREGLMAKRLRLNAAAANSRDNGQKTHHSSSSSSSSFAADDLLRRTRARIDCEEEEEEEEEQHTAAASLPTQRKAEPVKFVYMPLSPKPEGWDTYLEWKAKKLAALSDSAPLPLVDYMKFLR